MLKGPETIVVWRHWFGRSLRPGKPSNSPRGAEGATMARRVPFPPSSIPAYIEQSMKLFDCPRAHGTSAHMAWQGICQGEVIYQSCLQGSRVLQVVGRGP